jgi:hypothetical protein
VATDGVNGAGPPELYRTCRHLNPVFIFPSSEVPDGSYRVLIHCAEPHFDDCSVRRRDMTVTINGIDVIRHFDPGEACSGVCQKAVVLEFKVKVKDGDGMSIGFDGKGRDGFVMGIEILSK